MTGKAVLRYPVSRDQTCATSRRVWQIQVLVHCVRVNSLVSSVPDIDGIEPLEALPARFVLQ